jgi:hypothetical protein
MMNDGARECTACEGWRSDGDEIEVTMTAGIRELDLGSRSRDLESAIRDRKRRESALLMRLVCGSGVLMAERPMSAEQKCALLLNVCENSFTIWAWFARPNRPPSMARS